MDSAPSRHERGRADWAWSIWVLIALWGVSIAGCGGTHAASDVAAIDRAVASASEALIAAQSADGAWRSRTYGALKDGLSLTPSITKALAFAPAFSTPSEGRRKAEGTRATAFDPAITRWSDAARKGAMYLADRVDKAGRIEPGPDEMIYPVYTASTAVIVFSRLTVAGGAEARDAWLRELRQRQLAEPLGWGPRDPGFGAWGYSVRPPIKPSTASTLSPPPDADLSSTLFAVGALRIAGVSSDDPAIRNALVFVQTCQNYGKDATTANPSFDDGGFYFTPTDPVRNKAGEAGVDRHGRVRYHSYGSATADGVRALLRCGLAPDHPRVVAARRWLEHHFSATTNPGTFASTREDERDATYFYYCWSLAHAFRALGVRRIESSEGPIDWAPVLARELIQRQRADGMWVNRYTASKEDDPLIATPFAAGALAICRMVLAPAR